MKTNTPRKHITQDEEEELIKAAVSRVYAKYGTDLKSFLASLNSRDLTKSDGDKTRSQF